MSDYRPAVAGFARDLIVIGASAGGIEPLVEVVRGLPADLPAAVLVVVHIPPTQRSQLPAILSRQGTLPACAAEHGTGIEGGRIYVAPPNYHLLARRGYLELSLGPRENRTRPAIDPLFRSAARAYGRRVVGVILSGLQEDGSLGMAAIAGRGGVTIVQDPEEARFGAMPRATLSAARVDYILPVEAIAPLLARLARPAPAWEGAPEMAEDTIEDERPAEIERDLAGQALGARSGQATTYTCPECGGTLWEIERLGVTRFHCHTGHVYSADSLLEHQAEELEAALWSSVRRLTEKATLTREMARRQYAAGNAAMAGRFEEQAVLDERHSNLIRQLILGPLSPVDERPADIAGGRAG